MRFKNLETYAGLMLEVVSLLSLATSFVIFKSLSGVPVDYYILYTYLLQTGFFFSFTVLNCEKTDIVVSLFSEKYLHIARGVVGSICFLFISLSLQLIPAADTSAILKSVPVFVTVLAYLFLKERFGLPRVGLLVLTILGMILICRPTFIFPSTSDTSDRILGTLCAAASCVAASFLYIIQRKIRRTPVVITSLTNAMITVVLVSPSVIYRGSWRTVDCSHVIILFVSSACVLVGILLKIQASRMEEAGRLALVSVVDLPFTLLAEFSFFGTVPPWTSYVGAVIITVSIILVIVLKRRETAPVVMQNGELPCGKLIMVKAKSTLDRCCDDETSV